MSIIIRDATNAGYLASVNASGEIAVTGTLSGGGNNAASLTGSAVPTYADYVGFNSGGNLVGVSSGNPLPVTFSGTVAVTQSTSPWVVSLTSTTITGTVAVTQSTSPWVTAGNLTHNAAVPTTNNIGALVAVASSAAPTYNAGDQVLLSTDLSGNLRTAITGSFIANNNIEEWAGVTLGSPSNYGTSPGAVVVNGVNAFITNTVAVSGTVAISGTVAVTQSTSPWVVSLTSTTITGTVAVTQSTSPWVVGGPAASGTTTTGNPVLNGAVFNTTQPTVTTGQIVDAQATARGALIVATGVDAFTVAVSGTVAVTQSTSPWVVSLTSTTITGTVAVTQSTSPWVVSLTSTTVTNTVAENLTQVAGTSLGATAVTNFGTAPAAAAVMGVNASIYAGTTGLTATGSSLNANITNTVPVTLTSTTITGTVAVTQSTSPWVVAGALTNNNAAPTATLTGVLPAIAETAYTTVTYTTGDMVLPVTDLHGALNTDLQAVGGTAIVTAAAGVQKVGISGATGVTLDAAQNAAAPANELVVGGVYNTTIPALTAGNASQFQVDSTGSQLVNTEGKKQTYRVGIVGFTPIASTTSPAVSVTGSATKTVRILRIRFTLAATTGATVNVQLNRFSALSGGTANSQSANIAKMDTNNAAQTAVVNQWSAAATTATSAGILAAERFEILTASTSLTPGYVEWDFGDKNGQSCVLRGTADFVGFIFSGVGTTPVAGCWIEWSEE